MWFLVNSTPGSPTEEWVERWIKQTVRMAPACHPPFWFQSALVTWHPTAPGMPLSREQMQGDALRML
jgi:hypothetical protein